MKSCGKRSHFIECGDYSRFRNEEANTKKLALKVKAIGDLNAH